MRPPFTTAQRKVLRSMLGLLQGLVTESEANILKLDRCLVLISELPTARSMMGEEDDKVDGTENEVYVYFKGVAMLLKGLLDSMGEEGEGDEKAEAFLMEIGKIFSEVFPELTARNAVQEIGLEETAAKVEVEVSEQPVRASMEEKSQDEDLNEGHESLPQQSREHTNDQSTDSKHTTDPVDTSAITDSDGDLTIVSESRSPSRKRLLTAIPPWSTKRFRSERQYAAPDEMTARNINFYKAAILQEKQRREQLKQQWEEQQREKRKALQERLQKAREEGLQKALEEGLQKAQQQAKESRTEKSTNEELFSDLQILNTRTISLAEGHNPHDKAAVQISMASEVIRRLLGNEGIKQVQTLRNESRKSTSRVRWPEILQRSRIDYISDLIQFCKKYEGSNTALDWFGENLARSELDRACASRSKFHFVTAEAKGMMAFRIRHGRKLRILADAFGIGILAIIPQNPLIPLQGVEEAGLKHVVDSISTTKALYPRIKNVSEKARQMMFIAVVGTTEEFKLAANEVLRDLKNFYPNPRTTGN